jgi:hypothetical protein
LSAILAHGDLDQHQGSLAMAAVKPTSTQPDQPADDLAAKLYDMRKTMDPILYERVAAFHPHAATSDAALAAFKADYDRLESENKAAADKAKTEADKAKPTETRATP